MRNIIYISLCVLIAVLSGCEKSPQMLKPAGSPDLQVRDVNAAGVVAVFDDVDVIFSDSVPVNEAWVVGGKYLLDWINVVSQGDSIVITNENKGNWLRSYNKRPQVKMNPYGIHAIHYNASGTVSCEVPFVRDSLWLDIQRGGGVVELKVETYLFSVNNATGSTGITVSGNSHISYIYSACFGPVNCKDLCSQQLFLTNNGYADMHARAIVFFDALIGSSGDVYYYGNPEQVEITSSGSGSFIKMD